MNILYSGDGNISDGLILSVLSLIKHTDEKLNIFVLTAGFSANGREYTPVTEALTEFLAKKLREKNEESDITLIDISEHFVNEIPLANMKTRFTPCCMLRLFADKVESLPGKLLYLDNDVLCRSDLSVLMKTDMRGIEVAGVPDYYGRWFFGYDYINSGVLLLNMDEIRRTRLFEKCRQRCRNKRMFMPDQSAINKLAKSKMLLARIYNEQRKLRGNTVLQHFTTSFRFFPWFHKVSVKPWQKEKMHKVLRLFEYDKLINEYLAVKEEFENETRNTGILLNR